MATKGITDCSTDVRTVRSRTLMLDTAERIIATRGLEALSLRVVQEESNQRNKSAAAYHFGSREGLISAVGYRLMEHVNARRTELIECLEKPLDQLSPENLINLLVLPYLDCVLENPSSYQGRCFQQFQIRPSTMKQIWEMHAEGTGPPVRQALLEKMTDMPSVTKFLRLELMIILVHGFASQWEAHRDLDSASSLPADVIRGEVLDACHHLVMGGGRNSFATSHDAPTDYWTKFGEDLSNLD